jgi:DNA invertase Pin-like site-specific DNA recombinase
MTGECAFKQQQGVNEKGSSLKNCLLWSCSGTEPFALNPFVYKGLYNTINTLDWLDKNNVNVVIRSMGNLCSRVNGKRNEIWTLITATMSSLYQIELENLRIRTKMGREAYLMKGGVHGRPRFTKETEKTFLEKPKTKEIQSLLSKGKSLRDIAGRANCSINLVVKVIRMLEPTQVENVMVIAD